MKTIDRIVRPAYRRLESYTVDLPTVPIKLNQNEAADELPDDLKRAIASELLTVDWRRYPQLTPVDVVEPIASTFGLDPSGVLVSNGSNDVLRAIFDVSVGRGSRVVTLTPTFGVYRLLAEQREAVVDCSPLDHRFRVHDRDLIERSRQATLTIVTSPNSPTGTRVKPETIREVCRQTRGLVVIDEAYVEFTDQDFLPFAREFANLIITRTFSKAAGLAGLRVGWATMAPALARQVQKAILPFALDVVSTIAVRTILDNWALVESRAGDTVRERDRLIAAVANLPDLTVFPSEANFFVVESADRNASAIIAALLDRGILVRPMTSYGSTGNGTERQLFRVSVGRREENDAFVAALSEIVADVQEVRP